MMILSCCWRVNDSVPSCRVSGKHKGYHGSIQKTSKRVLFSTCLYLPTRAGALFHLKILPLCCRLEDIPELFIIGRPDMTVVAFGSNVVDIFEVNDIMSSKGWHLNALQRPNR